MRLIDLDKVKWQDGFYDMHTGEQFAPMMFNTPEAIAWAIAEAEVKAIPIEWIEEHLKKHEGPDWLAIYHDMIVSMVREWKKWEKENETAE